MTPASKSDVRVKLSRALPGSLSPTAMRLFLGKQIWLWPILAALVLVAVQQIVFGLMERSTRAQLEAMITTLRDADTKALRLWTEQQIDMAETLASADEVVRATTALADVEAHGGQSAAQLLTSPVLAELRTYMKPRIQPHDYLDFYLVSNSGRVIAALSDTSLGMQLGGYRQEFFKGALTKPALSLPYASTVLLQDAKGELRAGIPTMFVAAPVIDGQGKAIAALGLRIRPEKEFTEILQVAHYGDTGETYAFDRQGTLLSQSRFDKDLKRMGLIPDLTDSSSILTLQARDPGVDMSAGARPTANRADQPLTEMVASAVAGKTASNVDGYRDYRGVPVIGAWTWLSEYDFGIGTEVDVAEAYRPLTILRYAFWGLFALLAVSGLVIFLFMLLVRYQQRGMQQAVLAARQLGQYRLDQKIGAGGMGTVYRASHALLRRPTAIKLLEPDKMSPTAIARFQREVQLTSQLNHPNTIAIFDFGKTPEGLFYYAMEYLDGINLDDLVLRDGPLPEGRVISILTQICGSLAEAHGAGLIHRDIKPANILLNYRGGQADVVKVLDFGLAKMLGDGHDSNLTAAGALTGTPLYLAPEAIENSDAADARSDLYAVGAVGYFLLAGKPVFEGNTIVEICMQHISAVPVPPSQRADRKIGAQLEAIVLCCLAKMQDQRPATAAQLLVELQQCTATDWSPDDAEAWWAAFRAKTPAHLAETQAGPEPGSDTSRVDQTTAFSKIEQ